MTWTKHDQALLDDLTRRKEEHEYTLRAAVQDLVDRLAVNQYSLVKDLINNRKAFIEVLERFDEENP